MAPRALRRAEPRAAEPFWGEAAARGRAPRVSCTGAPPPRPPRGVSARRAAGPVRHEQGRAPSAPPAPAAGRSPGSDGSVSAACQRQRPWFRGAASRGVQLSRADDEGRGRERRSHAGGHRLILGRGSCANPRAQLQQPRRFLRWIQTSVIYSYTLFFPALFRKYRRVTGCSTLKIKTKHLKTKRFVLQINTELEPSHGEEGLCQAWLCFISVMVLRVGVLIVFCFSLKALYKPNITPHRIVLGVTGRDNNYPVQCSYTHMARSNKSLV